MPFSSVRRATRQALAWPAGPTLSGLALGAILAIGPAVVPAAQAAVCRVPGTYAAIQDAVNDVTCTRILVAAGEYRGTLAITRNVTLLGAGQDRTILDGAAGGSVVTIAPGVKVTITGVTIEGGNKPEGGGIYNQGTLTVDNSTLTANTASGGGGGIYNQGTLTVDNSTLTANTATGTFSGGGGIFNDEGTLTVENSTLTANTASFAGGGILNIKGTCTVDSNSRSVLKILCDVCRKPLSEQCDDLFLAFVTIGMASLDARLRPQPLLAFV
jgi:hypothetical protein